MANKLSELVNLLPEDLQAAGVRPEEIKVMTEEKIKAVDELGALNNIAILLAGILGQIELQNEILVEAYELNEPVDGSPSTGEPTPAAWDTSSLINAW